MYVQKMLLGPNQLAGQTVAGGGRCILVWGWVWVVNIYLSIYTNIHACTFIHTYITHIRMCVWLILFERVFNYMNVCMDVR